MRSISLKLPEELDERITAIARRRRTNRSAVVREALQAFTEGRSAESVTAAAGNLVGSLHGPADLATAAKHLAGFGE
jgi:Arc/MetJ-type ribon-helix-helix transcriptional regulator